MSEYKAMELEARSIIYKNTLLIDSLLLEVGPFSPN